MKNILIILFTALVFIPAFAENELSEQKFMQANKLYAKSQFEEALKIYEEIIADNYVSADLFFNTANSYYRTDKLGLAIYYYEKARMYEPNNEDVNYNLELAKLEVKDLLPEVPKIFPVRIFMQVSFWKSYSFWGLASLLFFSIILVFVWLFITSGKMRTKKISILLSIFFLFFSVLAFIFMQYNLSMLNAHDEAIVIEHESVAKSSPEDTANDLFQVYEGYKVNIENESGTWFEISLPDGKKAWLKKDVLKIL